MRMNESQDLFFWSPQGVIPCQWLDLACSLGINLYVSSVILNSCKAVWDKNPLLKALRTIKMDKTSLSKKKKKKKSEYRNDAYTATRHDLILFPHGVSKSVVLATLTGAAVCLWGNYDTPVRMVEFVPLIALTTCHCSVGTHVC